MRKPLPIAADDSFGLVRIDIWIVEQAHLELPAQHRRNEPVELRLGERSIAHEIDEVEIAVRLREFDVHTGANGEHARLALVGGDMMAVRIRPVAQLSDRVVVRHDEAVEAPLVAENVAQQPPTGV